MTGRSGRATLDGWPRSCWPAERARSPHFYGTTFVELRYRAAGLKALAPYKVHGQSAEAVTKCPWGERSFYVVDPWGNDLCFVEEGTLYT